MSDFPVIPTVICVFAGLLIIALCVANCARMDECEAKGGTWFQPYKSSGVCLKPGTVMP